ncbi:MAG: class I SAM-dependent methyltransferase [Defluviitaleaceae bacterium]|nr:class I SAM-dependent methyltransferase [Defluviitaleaceae bacterium]
MDVSKRIYSICKYLEGNKLADIGTDHCHLPIFAIKSGLASYAIGVDVNAGPLKSARENVVKEGLAEKIELRLGYGFKPIEAGECDTAVISGMGGMLISKIIEGGLSTALSFKQLILSPQSDAYRLRKSLHKFGFEIYNENMVKDGGKFYPLIMAQQGEDCTYSQFNYEFGKITLENPNEDFREFLEELWIRNENIINNNSLTEVRKTEILEVNKFIKGFLS